MKKYLLILLALAGCYTNRYPVTPGVVEGSTYKIFNEGYQGTAWAINKRHVVTAGHMCQQVSPVNYVLISSTNRHVPAHMVESEYGGGLGDLCVLETGVDIAPGLVIADEMPRVGRACAYVGYPNGEFTSNSGKYLGDKDVDPDNHSDDDVCTAPSDHGASGSAVYTHRGVIGVLVRGRMDPGSPEDGTDGFVFIPLKQLRAFLDDVGVKYDTTPDRVPSNEDVFPADSDLPPEVRVHFPGVN